MILPDPNFFGGNLLISKKDKKWETVNTESMLLGVPNQDDHVVMRANYSGIGLSDMISNINNKVIPRCSIDLSLHTLEIMEGILIAAKTKQKYILKSNCDQPKLLSETQINKLKIN